MDRMRATIFFSIVIFCTVMMVGISISKRKPLWHDEIWSLVSSIQNPTYSDIILTHFSGKHIEGNISPIFYLSEKAILDFAGYKLPTSLVKEIAELGNLTVGSPTFFEEASKFPSYFKDKQSQIFLRIQPVFAMAMTIALIFLYFSVYYSPTLGIYSLFVTLSSYMIWAHLAEARPYATWVLLSTIQLILFLNILNSQVKVPKKSFGLLLVTHLFLSLTIVLSLAQILIVSWVIFYFRKHNWKSLLFLSALPVTICISYVILSPRYQALFYFRTFFGVIFANFPIDRLLILGCFFILLASYGFQRWKNQDVLIELSRAAVPFFASIVLFTSAGFALLIVYKLIESASPSASEVSNRFWIFLTPASIFSTVLLPYFSYNSFKRKSKMRAGIIVVSLILLLFRSLQTLALVKSLFSTILFS